MATIKKGSYRWNGELTEIFPNIVGYELYEHINFYFDDEFYLTDSDIATIQSIAEELELSYPIPQEPGTYNARVNCSAIWSISPDYYSYIIGDVECGEYNEIFTLLYYLTSRDGRFDVYSDSKWNKPQYQTITVTDDTSVGADFYDWFNDNTEPGVENNVIKAGTYRFNDVPTINSDVNRLGSLLAISLPFSIVVDDGGITIVDEPAYFKGLSVGYNPNIIQYVDIDNSAVAYYFEGEPGWDILYLSAIYEYGVDNPKLKGYGQTITVLEDTEVDETFATWFTENTEPVGAEATPAVSITYKGEKIELSAGDIATLHIGGKKLTEDLVIKANEVSGGSSGGSCSGNHIIEVETLPTENIDESALYKCDEKYHKYFSKQFTDLVVSVPENGTVTPIYKMANADSAYFKYIYVDTKPEVPKKSEDGLYLYYVEDEDDVFAYLYVTTSESYDWITAETLFYLYFGITIPFKGLVSDDTLATELGLYAIGSAGWKTYVAPTNGITIKENGTFDVTNYETVDVDAPSEAVAGLWQFNADDGNYQRIPHPAFNEKVKFSCVINGTSTDFVGIDWTPKKDGVLTAIKADKTTEQLFHYGYWNITPATMDFGDAQGVHSTFKEFMTTYATPKYQIVAIDD